MSIREGFACLAGVVALLCPILPASGSGPEPQEKLEAKLFAPGEVIVKLARNGGEAPAFLQDVLASLGIETRDVVPVFPPSGRAGRLGDVYRLFLSDIEADVPLACSRLVLHPAVEYAEPNARFRSALTPNDHPDPFWVDARNDPATGDGYFYLIRSRNICGDGSYGAGSGGEERLPFEDCP